MIHRKFGTNWTYGLEVDVKKFKWFFKKFKWQKNLVRRTLMVLEVCTKFCVKLTHSVGLITSQS